VRLEQALGVSLRKPQGTPPAPVTVNGGHRADSLGSYSRRAVTWIEGIYVTVRPSFGDKEAIYAYRTDIAWDDAASSLLFARASGSTQHTASGARSPFRTSPASFISSPTGTVSTG